MSDVLENFKLGDFVQITGSSITGRIKRFVGYEPDSEPALVVVEFGRFIAYKKPSELTLLGNED